MKRLFRRPAILMGIGVVSLVVAACGGGGSAGPVSNGGPGPSDDGQRLGPIETPPTSEVTSVGMQIGKLAPNFRLLTPEGEAVALSDFRGRPVFINFWATWCGPCRSEMPELQEMHDKLGDEQLKLLAVDIDETGGEVVRFFEELGLTFTAVIDEGREVWTEYRLFGLPSSVVVDENGVVAAIKVGPYANADDINKSLEKVGLEI